MMSSAASENSGNGAAVTIYQVPEGLAKPLLWIVAGTVVLSLTVSILSLGSSLIAAPYLMAKAESLSDKSEDMTRYMVQVQYWGQRAELAANNAGVKLPPFPLYKRSKP